jgi:hypothetical protein
VRWDEENHMLFSNFPEAWHNVKAGIDRLFERFGTDNHVIALTSKTNFRRDIDPTYKGNRKGQRKPLCYARCVEQLQADYKTYCFDGLEADDVMGIFATRVKGSMICSMDKDMKTIPATIFNGEKVIYGQRGRGRLLPPLPDARGRHGRWLFGVSRHRAEEG